MPLKLAFVFNFKQHLNEDAELASRACYRGLLTVLRRHPRIPFNLHFSGTLIHALNWLDPEPLGQVRSGLRDGQFELLGSTYAQNLAYLSDDWDNAQQIVLHREVIREFFGVDPRGFWNPERTWRQSLAPVIADGGYRYLLMEDRLLRRGGADRPTTYSTPAGDGRSLTLIWDDVALKHWMNFAAWFGRFQPALDYLSAVADRTGPESCLLAYSEAAEAMGLWGWEQGIIPNQTWANLDALLTLLEWQDWLEIICLQDAPRPVADLGPLPDGWATWMDASLHQPSAACHEDGYADWYDFQVRSPRTLRFKRLYNAVRVRLQAIGSARQDSGFTNEVPREAQDATQRLYRGAIQALLSHQYEFGCVGVGGKGYRGWEQAVSAFALARAAEIAELRRRGISIEDVNGDGTDEVLVMDEKRLAVVATYGARLLYWFDLETGAQHVGNHLAVTRAPFVSDSKLPKVEPLPQAWLPECTEPTLAGLDEYRVEETAPTRMSKYLPDWVWPTEPIAVPLYVRPTSNGATRSALPAQRRAFNDFIRIDGGPELEPDSLLDYRFEGDSIVFIRHLPERLRLEKRFRPVDAGLEVTYRFVNPGAVSRDIGLRILSEFHPDYAEVLSGGQGTLSAMWSGGAPASTRIGVINSRTGSAVLLEPEIHPQAVTTRPGLLSLEVDLAFSVRLAAGTAEAFNVLLALRKLS